MEQQPFKLSVQLEGHSADVRSVAATALHDDALSPLILSGSRDGTARVWGKPIGTKSKRDIVQWHSLEGQAGFVNCCAWLRLHETGEQIALAGGQDHTINAYQIAPSAPSSSTTLTPDYTLLGHEDNVCALNVYPGPSGYIVSGSWDKTARVWKNWECVAVLGGHTQAVWAVLALDDDRILTASADKLIRQYSISDAIRNGAKSKPQATYAGHSDAVRGLLRIDQDTFASCGNDGNIHMYRIAKEASATPIQPVQTLSGHTSFVYSLALLPSGELASSGEDRSVRIWRAGSLLQTILVPTISVWSADSLQNGDVVCASSDGFVRLFTRTPQRMADNDILQAYDATISSQSLNKTQVGDVQKENLPGADALATPGREGQVKMIRNGDIVEAHQFSTASGGWQKVGEVVGGVGSSQKKLHEGKEYDYVFDVDIADGVPPLKLPYNASENPYMAAQRFLEKNELPLTYLDQVVQFIEKNTAEVSLGASEEFRDPYTGGSSYRPGGATRPAGSMTTQAPFASQTSTSTPSTSILPHQTPLTFKQFNEQGAKAKIFELNGNLTPSAALSAEESTAITALLSSLAKSPSNVDKEQFYVLQKILQRWPESQRFPLMDVYRVACLTSPSEGGQAAIFGLDAAGWSDAWPTSPEKVKARSTLLLLALRAAANAVSNARLDSIVGKLDAGKENIQRLSKPARVAFSTILLNASAVLVKLDAPHVEVARILLSLILHAVQAENQMSNVADRDGEAVYRASMSFGNVLVSKSIGSLGVGDVQTCQNAIKQAAGYVHEARLQSLLREIDSKSGIGI